MKQIYFGLLLLIIFSSCNEDSNRVTLEFKGPFYKEEVLKQFKLDSVPFNVDSKDLYIALVKNNSNEVITLEGSSQNQIYPDSSWIHTFSPFSAKRRSWIKVKQDKPRRGLTNMELDPKESKMFWFSNRYDDYLDSMTINFSYNTSEEVKTIIVHGIFNPQIKPKIKYQLIESNETKYIFEQAQISMKVEGPFTYQKTNLIMGTNIPYDIDSEEVFIFTITNSRDENLYVENWEYNEINIDTIYSFSQFTQTSKEKIWLESTSKKGELPKDTIVIQPKKSHMFWDSYSEIRPTTDSIVFIKTFQTEQYFIEGIKLFGVKKTISNTM